MPNKLADYHSSSTDWRHILKINQRKSYFVIGSYIFIYLFVGLLVDLYFYSSHYPEVSLSLLFVALITFQLTPIATLISLLVAGISLWITYAFHNRLMLLGTDYKEITPTSAGSNLETQLYNVVEEMKIAAGLNYMPKVYLINADYMNAFASGYSEKSAMVAITRGLIEKLDRSELQAVMAHELSHIRHLDIKLTLMASVLSNLILMLIDVLFYSALFGGNRRDENRSRNQLFFIIMLLRYLLPFITILLMLYLSRSREYMADAGCVELTRDNQPLARALLKIQQDHTENQDAYRTAYGSTPHETIRREAYIFDPVQAGIKPDGSIAELFSTHPAIEKRLVALGFRKKNTDK